MPINSFLYPAPSTPSFAYDVANSLRFNSGSSDFLNRTQSGAGNRKTFTFSVWLKMALDDVASDIGIFSYYNDVNNFGKIGIQGDNNQFVIVNRTSGTFNTNVQISAMARDTSAWLHLVVAVDTTQSTDSNRIKIYVNGTQQTSFVSSTYPSQNTDLEFNATHNNYISNWNGSSQYFDGYMTEIVFIDGQQLDPTSFGEFDSDSPNIWKPIDVSGLTFGTNGFYLDFENASSLGADVSGNSGNFTVNNLTSVDQTTDTCTNNFCTMNPLDNYYASSTFSEGNLKVVSTNSGKAWNLGTIGVSQGKWYWEVKYVASGGSTPSDKWNYIGISDRSPASSSDDLGFDNYQYSVYEYDGKVYASSSPATTYGAAFNAGDIVQIALDLNNNNIYFGVGGQWGNGSGSWNQSTPSSAISIQDPTGTLNGFYFPAFGDGGQNVAKTWEANFGSPPFSISSGNSDGNGYGNFEYSVPSGYYALNTKNLAEFG